MKITISKMHTSFVPPYLPSQSYMVRKITEDGMKIIISKKNQYCLIIYLNWLFWLLAINSKKQKTFDALVFFPPHFFYFSLFGFGLFLKIIYNWLCLNLKSFKQGPLVLNWSPGCFQGSPGDIIVFYMFKFYFILI